MKSTVAIGTLGVAIGLGLGFGLRGMLPTGSNPSTLAAGGTPTSNAAAAPTLADGGATDAGAGLTAARPGGPPVETQPASSTRVAASAAQPDAGDDSVVAELDASGEAMLDELRTLLASGRLEAHFGSGEGSLRGFLFSRYLELGDPDSAWLLLETHGGTYKDWSRLGGAFQSAGRNADAVAALSAAIDQMREDSEDRSVANRMQREIPSLIGRIARLDPHRAAQLAEEHFDALEGGAANDLALARHLLAAERSAEAEALIGPLLDHPIDRVEALKLLAQVDPEEAERRLSEIFELEQDPAVGAQLTSLLIGQGRTDEAISLLDQLIESGGPSATGVLGEVFDSLPQELVEEHMDRWIDGADLAQIDDNSVGLLSNAMELYVESGRPERAVDLQVRLLDALADGQNMLGWLPHLDREAARHNAVRLEPALRNAERGAGNNDEIWGDLADQYWVIGRPEDARRCWERARAIDPGDGEWTGKLRSVHDGNDPL